MSLEEELEMLKKQYDEAVNNMYSIINQAQKEQEEEMRVPREEYKAAKDKIMKQLEEPFKKLQALEIQAQNKYQLKISFVILEFTRLQKRISDLNQIINDADNKPIELLGIE